MKLVVACDPRGGIGYKNKLPWKKLQGDLPRFKALTDNQIVVMGRNTWESLPTKPLPNRTNVIVTSRIIDNLPKSIIIALGLNFITDDAWIIGGAKLINSSWDRIHEVHLTKTFKEYDCDTFIDLEYLHSNYVLIHTEECVDHEYQIWNKKDETIS